MGNKANKPMENDRDQSRDQTSIQPDDIIQSDVITTTSLANTNENKQSAPRKLDPHTRSKTMAAGEKLFTNLYANDFHQRKIKL